MRRRLVLPEGGLDLVFDEGRLLNTHKLGEGASTPRTNRAGTLSKYRQNMNEDNRIHTRSLPTGGSDCPYPSCRLVVQLNVEIFTVNRRAVLLSRT